MTAAYIREIDEFILNKMTKLDARPFLAEKGERLEDYDRLHLDVSLCKRGERGTEIGFEHLYYLAKVQLAEQANKLGCAYITDLSLPSQVDGHIVVSASGLKRR